MSRGWESKSVESQQAEQEASASSTAPGASPAPRTNNAPDAHGKRRRQELELQRERILSERTSSAHRRTALSSALASVEEELAQLGWTLHL